MIFKQHCVDMILSGKKTQTRRPNRGYYKVGHTYAIQPCRICKGIPNYRIEIDDIWEEVSGEWFSKNFYEKPPNAKLLPVTQAEASEDGYLSPFEFEEAFKEIYPKWDRKKRWAYKFHLVEVKNENR